MFNEHVKTLDICFNNIICVTMNNDQKFVYQGSLYYKSGRHIKGTTQKVLHRKWVLNN